MWSLSSSDEISTKLRESYKQNRHADDENQPLSVQPWGRDGDKRRYFLIEGQDDTNFRVYRENHRYTRNAQWYSMGGNIEEIRTLANKLEQEDGSQAARTLSGRMVNAISRFEAGEEVRDIAAPCSRMNHETNTKDRNDAVANTDKRAAQPLLALNLDSLSTKDEPEASECAIPSTMATTKTRMTPKLSLTPLRIAARLANPDVAHRPTSDLNTLQAVDRSGQGKVESMVLACSARRLQARMSSLLARTEKVVTVSNRSGLRREHLVPLEEQSMARAV